MRLSGHIQGGSVGARKEEVYRQPSSEHVGTTQKSYALHQFEQKMLMQSQAGHGAGSGLARDALALATPGKKVHSGGPTRQSRSTMMDSKHSQHAQAQSSVRIRIA